MSVNEAYSWWHTSFAVSKLKKALGCTRDRRKSVMRIDKLHVIRYGVVLGAAALISIIAVALGLPGATATVSPWRIAGAIVTGAVITICAAVCIAVREHIVAWFEKLDRIHAMAASAVLPIILILAMPLAAECYMCAFAIGLVVSGLGSLVIAFAFQRYDETRPPVMMSAFSSATDTEERVHLGGSDTGEHDDGDWAGRIARAQVATD